MESERGIRQSDYLGRYYTHGTVAALLVASMDVAAPETVVDLGAGNGTLIDAAAQRWRSARFLTVDIDKEAGSRQLPVTRGSAFRHFTADALEFGLNRRLGLPWGKACVGLCNPPYIKPRWRRHFGEIMEDVGLSNILPHADDVPADILFIAQNLRLLKNGGRLGMIVPDGLISGERFMRFRRSLVENHAIDQVIELPRGVFRRTEAKAHIAILTKGAKQQSTISLRKLSPTGELSKTMAISPDQAIARLDYGFHSSARPSRTFKGIQLAQLVSSISRGSLSSSTRQIVRYPVFHTTDFSAGLTEVPRTFALNKKQRGEALGATAREGDVLVARVGRNLSDKVCRVEKGVVAVSDCLLILRPIPGKEDLVFKILTSSSGRSAIDAISHGVGARFITAKALMALRF